MFIHTYIVTIEDETGALRTNRNAFVTMGEHEAESILLIWRQQRREEPMTLTLAHSQPFTGDVKGLRWACVSKAASLYAAHVPAPAEASV